MSEGFEVPSYLIPVFQLSNDGVEVTNPPSGPQTDKDGAAKENQAFPGMKAYRIGVELINSEREIVRGGETMLKSSVRPMNVTVWSSSMPDLSKGDWVRFMSLMVGSVDSNVFFQALGVEVVS